MVSITSEKEQKFVHENIDYDKKYYIGLSDFKTEGIFVWMDGSMLTYKNWQNGEPNNYKDAYNCVILNWIKHDKRGKWNDFSCDLKFNFICKRPIAEK